MNLSNNSIVWPFICSWWTINLELPPKTIVVHFWLSCECVISIIKAFDRFRFLFLSFWLQSYSCSFLSLYNSILKSTAIPVDIVTWFEALQCRDDTDTDRYFTFTGFRVFETPNCLFHHSSFVDDSWAHLILAPRVHLESLIPFESSPSLYHYLHSPPNMNTFLTRVRIFVAVRLRCTFRLTPAVIVPFYPEMSYVHVVLPSLFTQYLVDTTAMFLCSSLAIDYLGDSFLSGYQHLVHKVFLFLVTWYCHNLLLILPCYVI